MATKRLTVCMYFYQSIRQIYFYSYENLMLTVNKIVEIILWIIVFKSRLPIGLAGALFLPHCMCSIV